VKPKSAPAGAVIVLTVCMASEGGGRERNRADVQLNLEGTSHFPEAVPFWAALQFAVAELWLCILSSAVRLLHFC